MTLTPLLVGLTGGIASGKTTVAETFASYGIDIIDSDVGAREVVKKGTLGLEEIVSRYGDSILLRNPTDDNLLNRPALRRIIFEDDNERQWLNDHLHPLIREWVNQQISFSKSRYVINSVPLLVESNLHTSMDVVVVVDVPEHIQISRLIKRDGGTEEDALKILKTQASRSDRLACADYVIDNSESLEYMKQEVAEVHGALLERCDRREM